MLIKIKTIPNSKKEEITKEGDIYKVKVNAPAIDGKANKAVIGALAEFFNTKRSHIRILKGERSRIKVVEVQP